MIVGGWLERVFIESGALLVFRKGKYFSVTRLNKISKRAVWIRFVSMVIKNPSCGNNAIKFFLIL